MADAVTTFASLSNDAPNVYIASKTYALAERRLVLGKFATRHQLPQRTGKTLRVIRPKRLNLPTATLVEGQPPDAVALVLENVDVTVEQWGIVVLLTDVALITTKHPMLNVAIDRTAMAMAELLEREIQNTLMSGTQVYFPGVVNDRTGLTEASKIDTATIIKATVALRDKGAPDFEGGLYGGAMSPQQEGDVLASDQTFRDVESMANVRRFEYAEIGVWMAVRWTRGNFLPKFRGEAAPNTAAATSYKPQITAVDGGGTIPSAQNFKFAVVYREKNTDREVRITQTSADIPSAATGNNESFTVTVAASDLVNHVYDVYMTVAGGAGSLFKVKSRVDTASTTITAVPSGTEVTKPVAPASGKEVFVAFIVGRDAFGRVELDGMSLQSFITPPGASWSNPLAQGRKVGNKIMWKSFVKDNEFFCRIETGSAQTGGFQP